MLIDGLPESIIERYFADDAEYLPLLTDGVLSPEGDGLLAVSDDR